jgi:hypothetical protein
MNPAYSRSSVMSLRPWVFKQCEMLCDQMASASATGVHGVDVVKYFRMLAGDTSLKMAFNINGNMVKDGEFILHRYLPPLEQDLNIELPSFYSSNHGSNQNGNGCSVLYPQICASSHPVHAPMGHRPPSHKIPLPAFCSQHN